MQIKNQTEVKIAQLREQQKLFGPGATLPEICLWVRQSIRGDADPYPDEKLRCVRDMIVGRLACWYQPTDEIDSHVFSMCQLIVRMADAELASRAARCSPIVAHPRVSDSFTNVTEFQLFRKMLNRSSIGYGEEYDFLNEQTIVEIKHLKDGVTFCTNWVFDKDGSLVEVELTTPDES